MLNPQTNPSTPRTKAEIARENGSKSRGPITPEGKSRSSLNSVKHSLTAKIAVVSTEDQDRFIQHCQSYVTLWKPQNIVENDLVEEMAEAKWQEKRCRSIETAVLNFEMQAQDVAPLDETTRLALAFMKVADGSKVLQLLLRYSTEHNRRYHRAMKQLIALRTKGVFMPAQAKKRNEPTHAHNTVKTNEQHAIEPRAPRIFRRVA